MARGQVLRVEGGDVADLPVFDPSRPSLISAWGRKRSGKSTFNRRIFRSYPYDKLCIDVNGDADPGPDAERIGLPLPARFPDPPAAGLGEYGRQMRHSHRTLHFRADPGSPTYTDDLDRAVGMALFPQQRHVMVWCGEVAEFMPSASSTGPHMRRLLQQNRHYGASGLFDGPRPVNVNPLVLHQSDYVAVYQLPNPDDRERIARSIGFPVDLFHEACADTWRKGPHWFLLWDAENAELYRCAPLPADDEE